MTDLAFSRDGRWLASVSFDGVHSCGILKMVRVPY
ncbi:MAG: hypothetical protein HZY76_12080 [Anaerolineae bacterium]|nr:MAG: hypothetical protein HZY76_12080 [Anaerolineae bacterium]